DYTFTAADAGAHTFSATLKRANDRQSLTATDTTTASITGTQTGILVNPGAAATFVVLPPSPPGGIQAGVEYPYLVGVMDAYGNQVYGYTGTVHITSSDPQATIRFTISDPEMALPADYTFRAGGGGAAFYVTLRTRGNQTITLFDTLDPSITATVTV